MNKYILGFQDDKTGNFDVFAKVRGNRPESHDRNIILFPSKDDIVARINKLLQEGIIIKDEEGYYLTGGQE